MTSNVAVPLDLDGTLVDANYQHALAWFRALRDRGIVVPIWRLHRHIGTDGDQLVAAVAGDEVEGRYGDELRDAKHDEFLRMRDECELLQGARELLDRRRLDETPIADGGTKPRSSGTARRSAG